MIILVNAGLRLSRICIDSGFIYDISNLTEKQRELYILVLFGCEKYKDAALSMGVSYSRVRQLECGMLRNSVSIGDLEKARREFSGLNKKAATRTAPGYA